MFRSFYVYDYSFKPLTQFTRGLLNNEMKKKNIYSCQSKAQRNFILISFNDNYEGKVLIHISELFKSFSIKFPLKL